MHRAMRQVIGPTQHVADLVMHTHAGGPEGPTGEPCAIQRFSAAIDIRRARHHLGQCDSQSAYALLSGQDLKRRHTGSVEALDEVRECVHATCGRDVHGQGQRECGVIDHRSRQDLGIAPRDLAVVLGEPPNAGHLTSGIRRRHRQDGEPGLLRHCLGHAGG